MSNTLHGKTAFITGASRGIGAAIARRLAADGANIAITYASGAARAEELVAEIEAAGGKAIAFQADSANEAALTAAIDATAKQFGSLDILVNNAGIARIAPISELSTADFDAQMTVNVRALFLTSKAALPHMPTGGRIIHIGSTNAERIPFAGGTGYAASKAAVVGLTKAMARELGPKGITVNNVEPGPVNTDMNPDSGPFAESIKATIPLARYAQAPEIAGMVSYLASPEAAYVTGANLLIDGGFAA